MVSDDRLPGLLPTLARGKHRNPRKGACFMEFASLLAGERWSDSPACTHPLLAAVARHVNDFTADAARPRLAVLVPQAIDACAVLVGGDPEREVAVDPAVWASACGLAGATAAADPAR
jgi:hypothetical protein